MALNRMQDLFNEQIADLYSAEQQLIEALPKMARAATDTELRTAFENHLEETRGQKRRLEQVFEHLGMRPQTERCEAMAGLIKEGDEIIEEEGAPAIKDAALIAAAQRVEHYEIAAYGTVRAFADLMDMDDVRDLLDQTLEEESDADKKLNNIAMGGLFESGINEEAMA
ncbi:MAG: ferritin-like domain-containing protein [Thermomicrobiales bacterium]